MRSLEIEPFPGMGSGFFVGVTMNKYRKQDMPPKTREKVFRRDGYRCRYCGKRNVPFCVDHVYPESKGGAHTIDNFVTACEACNAKKHAKIGVWPMPIGYFSQKYSDVGFLRFINFVLGIASLVLAFVFFDDLLIRFLVITIGVVTKLIFAHIAQIQKV